jgi:Domain of unknown function (DUF4258)
VTSMRLIFTTHANDRMQQRGVTRRDVERCLDNYVERIDTRKGVRYKGPGRSSDRMLKVWVVPTTDVEDEPRVIKSVAWEGEDDE